MDRRACGVRQSQGAATAKRCEGTFTVSRLSPNCIELLAQIRGQRVVEARATKNVAAGRHANIRGWT